MSGAEAGIQLKDIKVDDLRIVSAAKITIAPAGNTSISNTTVSPDAVIDATQGSWGSVRLARTISPESVVELKGTFDHDVFVRSAGILKADQNATVNKVIVMPQESGLVTLA